MGYSIIKKSIFDPMRHTKRYAIENIFILLNLTHDYNSTVFFMFNRFYPIFLFFPFFQSRIITTEQPSHRHEREWIDSNVYFFILYGPSMNWVIVKKYTTRVFDCMKISKNRVKVCHHSQMVIPPSLLLYGNRVYLFYTFFFVGLLACLSSLNLKRNETKPKTIHPFSLSHVSPLYQAHV